MTTNKPYSINGDGDQPVTQAEFSTMMTAIKENLDQLATKEDLELLRTETKAEFKQVRAEVTKLREITEKILEVVQASDERNKPLRDLPERMERVERAIFH